MEMEKKNLAIIILAVVLAASGVGNIILGISAGAVKAPEQKNVLKIGTTEGSSPAVLDPVDSWDSVSNDVIAHVCDTLWTYDLYDPDYALLYTLAAEAPTWNGAKDELTVILRENVWFHDGTPFNATAVKFTFDRIAYFCNVTGTLPSESHVCDPSSLFYDLEGNFQLNETVINGDYNVTFVLFKPNAIFVPLLSYRAWSIVSPRSTPATDYLVLGEDKLIGTGPFKYEVIVAGEEQKFVRWDLYWGKSTFWDEIIWIFYPDTVTAGNALLGGEVHRGTFPSSMIPTVQADPNLVFVNLETSFIYRYWGINNHKINNTNIRKAIAYAYNYTYYIQVIRLGFGIRATHFLPPGFPYYNASFISPDYDTVVARQAMLAACADMGWDATGLKPWAVGNNTANDAAWEAKTFVTYLVQEHEGWTTGIAMNEAFRQDLAKIGIALVSDVMDWERYIYVSSYEPDILELFHTGWGPDYLDPFNMVEPLLSNLSTANHIQLNDPIILGWLLDYQKALPTDAASGPLAAKFNTLYPVEGARKAELLYYIQNRAINVLYAEMPTMNDMVMYGHHKSLGNVCYNVKRDLWCRDSYLIPGVPTI
ncbi:MAG: ABC transporter substrate-binding protein [Promethearchaeota archaeon]